MGSRYSRLYGYWHWTKDSPTVGNPGTVGNPDPDSGRGRRPRRERRSRGERSSAVRSSRSFGRFSRVNPDQAGPVQPGPWDALFLPSDQGSTGANLVIFPVNPSAVKMATKAFDLNRRYPLYLRAAREFVQVMEKFNPAYKARMMPKGVLDENALGDVLEEVSADETLEEKDPVLAKEALEAAGKIHFDMHVSYTGSVEDYLPLGLQEEWSAIRPLPSFGILSGEGILGFSTIDAPAFENQVLKLSAQVARGIQPGSEGSYPLVPVGQARSRPSGFPPYHLFLMASGQQESAYKISPMGLGENKPILADGLVRSILEAHIWNLSESTWNKGSSLIFALPAPLYDKKHRELTGVEAFANTVCAPTITYKTSGIQLDVTFGPEQDVRGGRLTLGHDVFVVTAGSLDIRSGVYAFTAERDQVALRGRFSVEHDGQIKVFLVLQPEEKLYLTGTGRQLEHGVVLDRAEANYACPSPVLQNMLARAVARLLEQDPTDVLSLLQRGDLSAEDRGKIHQLLAIDQSCSALTAVGPLLSAMVQRLVREGVRTKAGEAPLPADCSASPLFFLGFGDRAPGSRVFPVDRATVVRAVEGGRTFVVTDPRVAARIGLTEVPPDDAERGTWEFRDRYHRWVVFSGGQVVRVTLVNFTPGQWTYSVQYGDGTNVPSLLIGQIVQRELDRTAVASRVADQVRTSSVQLVSRLISPLIRAAENKLPGLSSLPVSIRGAIAGTAGAQVQKVPLPLQFYMAAESTLPGEPSWYGDPHHIRDMPGMRQGAIYARAPGQRVLPTLLLMQRAAKGANAPGPKHDALGHKYKLLEDEIERFRRDYTLDEMKKTLEVEGERGAQALTATLFDTKGRVPSAQRTIPLSPIQQGQEFIPSPIERVVFTMWGVLNETNVAAMKRRNEALGGSDDNPIDSAYRAYLSGDHTLLPVPPAVSTWQSGDEALASKATRVHLRFKTVFANAILSGNKDEEYRKQDLLSPGELGVVRLGGPRGRDVYMRLKGKRAGVNAYALSFDGSFTDIKVDPKFQQPRDPRAVLEEDPSWTSFKSGGAPTTHAPMSEVSDEIRQKLGLPPAAPKSNPFHRRQRDQQGQGQRRFAPKRNPAWFPEYGVFYQTEMTPAETEKVLYNYKVWADANRGEGEIQEIKLSLDDPDKELIATGRRTMTTRRRGLRRGQIGSAKFSIKEGKLKRKGAYKIYARSWGPTSFEDFTTELGHGDTVRGLNEYVRRAGLPTVDAQGRPLPMYRSPADAADARVVDVNGKLVPLFLEDEHAWIKGRRKLVVHDISFDDKFTPLPGGDMVFNRANAIRKAICDRAGLTRHPSATNGGETLAETWDRKRRGQEAAPLEVAFSLVGTMQVSLTRLEKLSRKLAKALPVGPDTGLLLFSMRIPTGLGGRTGPDAQEIDGSLYTDSEAPDGLKPGGPASFALKQLSEYLTHTEWMRGVRRIEPLVGSAHRLPNILTYGPVSQTRDFARALESIQEDDQKRFEADQIPIPPIEFQQQWAYYSALNGAVAGFYGSRRIPEAVVRGREAYAAHGGWQARAVRMASGLQSPDPAHQVFGTMPARAHADFFGFANQLCQVTGICTPHLGGKRTEVIALTRAEGNYLDVGSLIAGPRSDRVIDDIRAGRLSEITVPEEVAFLEGIEEGVSYLADVGGQLFDVNIIPEADEFKLSFSPVKGQPAQDKLFALMASMGIELPTARKAPELAEVYAAIHGKQPSKAELAKLLHLERLAYMRALKPALERFKNEMQLQYRHRMNLGLLPEQMERAALEAEASASDPRNINEVGPFAEYYLDELARPNSRKKAKRNPRSRRNPLDEAALQKILAYAQGRGDEAEARAAFEELTRRESPELWNIDQNVLETLFPKQGKERPDTWNPVERIRTALGPGGFDAISRLSRIRPDTIVGTDKEGTPVTARQVMREGLKKSLPFEDEKALELIMAQSQLSLEEAIAILGQQRGAVSRRGTMGGRLTMQPSSAICKLYRKRKLVYRPPEELGTHIDLKNSVVILMSPKDRPIPRVMTWRRGDHIDCDMVGVAPEDLAELLGKAIQSALYWVAEKPQRRMMGAGQTAIYVGRVGDPGLYKIWEAGRPVSLATVNVSLSKGASLFLWQNPARGKDEVDEYVRAEKELGITRRVRSEAATTTGGGEEVETELSFEDLPQEEN